ncbi:MAG: AtpZ/AtpI family protein [Elusimicrobia bacterium]|nr:AtpZ/AtpI family protein [Elusimicrobiota bacterium]
MPSKQTEPSSGRPKRPAGPLGAAFSLGMELAVAMLLGVVGGRWADARLGTSPWLLLAGVALGFAAGMYLLVTSAKQTPPDRP